MANDIRHLNRVIFINNSLGRRKLKETLGNLLVGLIFSPEDIWLISPWVSDFELLDNRAGDWNAVDSSWGTRQINFSELLICAMNSGCCLHFVTTSDSNNRAFIERLRIAVPDEEIFQHVISEKLHIKGLLTSSFFLAGSMNFTYSGAHINDEQINLSIDPNTISEARIEVEQYYVHKYGVE